MNIWHVWYDEFNSWLENTKGAEVELCAMAPYADEKDLSELERRRQVAEWDRAVREAWNRRNPWTI